MNLFHDLDLGNEDLSLVNSIIEIPKGSMVKYEFDKWIGAIVVDRIFKAPMPYPVNYGLLPKTWNVEDNDPIDIIVLSRWDFHPWVVVPSRIVWGLNMIDSWEFDYKIIAVAEDPYYDNVNDINDVNPKEKEDIEFFMNHYKKLQNKEVKLEGWDNKAKAIEVLKKCVKGYDEKFQ